MKHSNVALFVPHNGCPHACTFCNQRQITGKSYQPTAEDVVNAVETARVSLGENTRSAEIAFFGGSFTAIEREYMTSLLEAASPFVKTGEFYGIRISTRPDAIDNEVLDLLKDYGVTSIELGAQSMSDRVLEMNRRGHTSQDVAEASRLIKEKDFSLGLQMMTGLYGSSYETDIETARRIAQLRPDTVRIYPTIVLRGTELYELYEEGKYQPEALEEAVPLCAELLSIFEKSGISVIRLGLHDSGSLRDSMAAGAYHPAFRELCESEIMYSNAIKAMEEAGITAGAADFYVSAQSVSRFIGQRHSNIARLRELGVIPTVCRDDSLSKYEVRVTPHKP